jgi:protein SCO1/2
MKSAVAAVSLSCVVMAAWAGTTGVHSTTVPQSAGFFLPRPQPLQPFRLVDEAGNAFTLDDLRDRWTLLAFGYTHCPDVCPTTLTQARAVTAALSRADAALELSVVFVSIDPQRDSGAQLQQYASKFANSFTGVGGAPLDVESFTAQFKVKYAIAGGTSGAYFLDHTSSVALISPRGELRALFSVPLRPEAVAADIKEIARADMH